MRSSPLNKVSHMVCLGASAGGLAAYREFLENVKPDDETCFVLVQHLAPEHQSELTELLARTSKVPIHQIEGGEHPEPGHAYVIPPGRTLVLRQGRLTLEEVAEPRGQRTPIDKFLFSMANELQDNAVCAILSGTGSDGSLGLRKIKEMGGLVLAQSPEDSEFSGMPESAIATGLVDFVASAGKLPQKLTEALSLERTFKQTAINDSDEQALKEVFATLRAKLGHDFRSYKRSTLKRRLLRRMQVHQCASIEDYAVVLQEGDDEAKVLFRDLLLSVTNFFRDPDSFAALSASVVQKFRPDQGPIRIWVPGCATGEEAYSIAMLVVEACDQKERGLEYQIFASDLDDVALRHARTGVYSEEALAHVSPARQRRFFERVPGGYKVVDTLRENILFTHHNILQDAPFARLDLVSCRNLLIYLQRDVQERLFQLFAFALKQDGFLFLGNAENGNRENGHFKDLDGPHRIYQRKSSPSRAAGDFRPHSFQHMSSASEKERLRDTNPIKLSDLHRRSLLERFAPPSLLVDQDYQIRHLFGTVGRFLERSEGDPSHNLMDNLPKGLRLDVRTGLYDTFHHGRTGTQRRAQYVSPEGEEAWVEIHIEPVRHQEREESYASISLSPIVAENRPVRDSGSDSGELLEQMEDELKDSRERLRTVVEEFETSNEELKSSNEELQSMNEELRSTSEELETSREELQSTNEELISVNQELKNKIEELNDANSDLQNLLATVDVATLFIDREFRIRRFTAKVEELFHLISTDIGRPLSHVVHRVIDCDILAEADKVLTGLIPSEQEVESDSGEFYLARFLPYRSGDRIEGVVITFLDITQRRRERIRLARFAERQDCLAELGLKALRKYPLDDLFQTAVTQVRDLLDIEYVKILRIEPNGEVVRLVNGVGWHEGIVGNATIPVQLESQAGYTLRVNEPVVVNNLLEEKRFQGPDLLFDHGVLSGISVVIEYHGAQYGVLGVHSQELRDYDDIDVTFLQAVANILGSAVDQRLARRQLEEQRAKLEAVLEQMPAAVVMADKKSGGDLTYVNRAARTLLGEESRFRHYHFDGTSYAQEEEPMYRALEGDKVMSEELALYVDGDSNEIRHYLCNAATVTTPEGETHQAVAAYLDITARRRSEERLQKLTESLEEAVARRTGQVRALAAELTRSEQEERRRLSSVLHDDLQQLLYSAQVQLHMLEVAGAKDKEAIFEMVSGVIERSIEVTRTLTMELSPPVLDGGSMQEALGWLAEQMKQLYGLDVEVVASSKISIVDKDFRSLLLQILRELLFNIVRHAEVNEARVLLVQHEDGYRITVEDRGRGFSPDSPLGVGLTQGRERVRLLGGELGFSSEPGKGTKVHLTIPLGALRER